MFLGPDVFPAKLVATPLGVPVVTASDASPLWIRCVYWEVASTKSGTSTDEFWNEAALNGILDHPPVILCFKLMIL